MKNRLFNYRFTQLPASNLVTGTFNSCVDVPKDIPPNQRIKKIEEIMITDFKKFCRKTKPSFSIYRGDDACRNGTLNQ